MRRLLFVLPIILLSVAVRADLPVGPRPSRPITRPPVTKPSGDSTATLAVTVNDSGSPARLRLPRSLVQSLLPPQARSDAGGIGPTRTVMAGLAICAAVTLGGLTFARRKGTRFGRMAVPVTACMLIFAAVQATADIRPTPRDDTRSTAGSAAGSIPLTVELTDGDVVEMQLPGPVKP
jgi:hypothetical protein